MTPDGRFVLFASTAPNLALTTNGSPYRGVGRPVLNVFLRDRQENSTVLITPGADATEFGNKNSLPLALSTNGQLVLVESTASNLVSGDTNEVSDIFLRDIAGAQTTLVSVGTNGIPANGPSYNAVMTPDGRYVAFASQASNLVPNDTNKVSDVFLRDVQAGTTILVSTNLQPTLYTNLGCDLPVITPSGQKIAFLFKGRSGSTYADHINVRDVLNRTTLWGSSDAGSLLGISQPGCFGHVISEDGAFVAYEAADKGSGTTSTAVLRRNLNSGVTDVIHRNGWLSSRTLDDVQNIGMPADGQKVVFLAKTNLADNCVLMWEASSGSYTLASASLTGEAPVGATCHNPRIDIEGHRVTFVSTATNLVTNVLAGSYHMFERDLESGTTSVVDLNDTGSGWPLTSFTVPVLSANGQFATFEAVRPDLTSSQSSEVFLIDRQSGAAELVSKRAQGFASATIIRPSYPSGSALSADGRLFAFSSDADDVVANDQNGFQDVFVRDLVAGTNMLVSVNTNGASGNGPSLNALMSGNGRHVAFASVANDLVQDDNKPHQDVFVRDLQSGETVLASRAFNGGQANGDSTPMALSHDGRRLLFRSFATDLVPGFTTAEQLFWRDFQRGTNVLLTTGSGSVPVAAADMTPDGRFVVYSHHPSLKVRDLELGQEKLNRTLGVVPFQVAIAPSGSHIAWLSNSIGVWSTVLHELESGSATNLGSGTNWNARPCFSADSRWLVFSSQLQGRYQLYLRDIMEGTNVLVSRDFSSALPAAGNSDSPSISGDGRFVAYRSSAENIVPGDTNGFQDVFLFDRVSEATVLLSRTQSGLANSASASPSISADGQTVVFRSWASNLEAYDFNEQADLFAYNILPVGSTFYLQAVTTSGLPTLIWPASEGKAYRVQYKTNLTQTGWQDAPGEATIAGSQASYTDPSPSAKKFFRVVEEDAQ
jgi:Tol biopolymer transport system component